MEAENKELIEAINEAISTIEMLIGDTINASASISLAAIIKARDKALSKNNK